MVSEGSRGRRFRLPGPLRRRSGEATPVTGATTAGQPWAADQPPVPAEPPDTSAKSREGKAASPQQTWPEALHTQEFDATVEVTAASCSKGADPSEDAFSVAGGRIAVADGASSSWEAGRWAQALADAWVDADRAGTGWFQQAKDHFAGSTPQTAGALGWLEDAAAQRGAHAAFLGVTFDLRDTDLEWQAQARGDVTAVVIAPDGITEVFPDPATHGFGSHPALLSSLATEGEELDTHTARLAHDQCLLVLSDAVAEFVVTRADHAVLEQLRCAPIAAVAETLTQAARSGHIEVDDLTVVRARPRTGEAGRTG